jgi:hypothetical protein
MKVFSSKAFYQTMQHYGFKFHCEQKNDSLLLVLTASAEMRHEEMDTVMTLCRNKLSRNDIEWYFLACFFANLHRAKLLISMSPCPKLYFSLSCDAGLGQGDHEINSLRRLTEARIIRAMYAIIT